MRKRVAEWALDIRREFYQDKFTQKKNENGYTVNASDDDFDAMHGGMCRDFTRQQARYITEKIPPNTLNWESIIFIPLKPDGTFDDGHSTHAFTIIYDIDMSVYVPETSLDTIAGVWYFPTINDCLNFMAVASGYRPRDVDVQPELEEYMADVPEEGSSFGFYSYNALDDKLIGMGRSDTMNYIIEHGNLVPFFPKNFSFIYEALRMGG